ncbi:MAG: cytochrome c [Puniceicoccaceae bacterium]
MHSRSSQVSSNQQIQSLIGIWGSILVFTLVVTSVRWLNPEQSALVRTAPAMTVAGGTVPELPPASQEFTEVSSANPMVRKTYQLHCASCHGMPGEPRVAGLTGSDLFDGQSERPFTRESILQILREGLLEKGMLPMTALLSESEIEAIADFLLEQQPG